MAAIGESFRRDKRLEKLFLKEVVETDNVLGTGSYGSVIEVKYKNDFYAAKQVHNILIEHGNMGIRTLVEKYKQECLLMADVSHPNLTKFIGLCNTRGSKLPLLVMEKMATDLEFVLEHVPCLPLSNKLSILHNVCSGLAYLHSRRPPIIHRDLTARNILLTPTLLAKISDLGNSKRIALNPGSLAAILSKYPGTLDYMPPEALDEEHRYGPSLDIFSFGHLSLYTLTQTLPKLLSATYTNPASSSVQARSEEERRDSSMKKLKSLLEDTHPFLVKMVSDCFSNIPSNRPSIKRLLDLLELKTEQKHQTVANSKILKFTVEDGKINVRHKSGDTYSHANYSLLGQQESEATSRDINTANDLLHNVSATSHDTAPTSPQWRRRLEIHADVDGSREPLLDEPSPDAVISQLTSYTRSRRSISRRRSISTLTLKFILLLLIGEGFVFYRAVIPSDTSSDNESNTSELMQNSTFHLNEDAIILYSRLWEREELNILVIGGPGTGKSTLLESLFENDGHESPLSLDRNHQKTTVYQKSYFINSVFISYTIWNHPKHEDLDEQKTQDLKMFDLILYTIKMSETRFSPNDSSIMKTMLEILGTEFVSKTVFILSHANQVWSFDNHNMHQMTKNVLETKTHQWKEMIIHELNELSEEDLKPEHFVYAGHPNQLNLCDVHWPSQVLAAMFDRLDESRRPALARACEKYWIRALQNSLEPGSCTSP